MREFKFDLSDRVTIVTEDLGVVEGVVSGAKAILNGGNEYDVHYLMPDLRTQHTVVGEATLADMQPPEMVSLSEARDMVEYALKRSVERAASRRRKASRSRKRR